MFIAVVGSRCFNNANLFFKEVSIIKNISLIISGGAAGADTYAEKFADFNKIPKLIIKPNYVKYGKNAPLVRNHIIIRSADFILIFWNGKTTGTAHALSLAKKYKKPYKIIWF